MLSLKFDVRDLFRAPRLAFSLQRMWIMLIGTGVGWLIYLVLTYLSMLTAGWPLSEAWERFGILPCLFAARVSFPWYSWLIYALGAGAIVIAFMLANTALARAVYMSAKGEHFYSWRQSYAFAWRKLGAVIMTPASLALLILLLTGGGFVIGLIGRIPVVGEIGIGLFTIIWFVVALLILFLGAVLWFSFFYAPAIVATTDEDAFESVFQLFSLTWNQPLRLLAYEIIAVLIALIFAGLFAFFCKRAVGLTNILFSAFMGSNFADIANNGQALVQAWTLMGEDLIFSLFRGFTPYLFYTQEFYYLPVHELARPTIASAAFLYALGLLFLGVWVFSYGLAAFNAGHTLAYLALRKKKDGMNLLERKDKEEEVEEELEEENPSEEPAAAQN